MRATAELRRRILNRTARIAVIGQGYVGLSLACAAADAGFSVTGIDVDPQRIADLAGGRAAVAGVDEDSVKRAFASELPRFSTSADAVADSHLVFICVPTPLRDGTPDLHVHRRRLPGGCRPSRTRVHGRARVNHVPRDDRRAGPAAPRVVRALRGRGLPARVLPGADRPGQRRVHVPPGPSDRGRDEPGVDRRRGPVLRAARGQGHAGLVVSGGRAREAPGEHVPPREHRARERDGDDVSRGRDRRLGGDRRRRRRSRSASCRSTPVPAWADTASPSTRATWPGRSGAMSDTSSGCSRRPRTSTRRCRRG